MKKLTMLIVFVLAFVVVGVVNAQEIPSVVTTTQPVDPYIRAMVDNWLASSAPVSNPYWAITYVGDRGGSAFVSLVALNISNPTDKWHVTDGEVIAWMGSIIVNADGSVELYSDGGASQARGGAKLAAPAQAGGGSSVRFPWQAGGTMMYGPSGVHTAGGGSHGTGFSAVDFVSGDDMGSGAASNQVYAVSTGTVDYVCTDSTTTMIRTGSGSDYYIYAHLLTNANLAESHQFARGALIGNLKYGSFDDTCGWAEQADNHYHLHFGFEPANNAFRMENCILNISTQKWTCGTEVVATGGFLSGGGGGISTTGDDAGMSADQPSFWDYTLVGVVSMWDKAIIKSLPSHQTMQYTYVIYNGVKVVLRVARVMVYSNLNLGHFMAIFMAGLAIKIALGTAESIMFLFKAWKSLVPVIGS